MVLEYEQGILFEPESSTAKSFSCSSCGLYEHVKSPRMEPYGKFRKGILNIGEAPGEVEDNRGKPWQGRAGQVLHRAYREVGIDLFEDCLNVNAVSCRPTSKTGSNRTPTDKEIQACRGNVFRVIKEYKPKVVVLFGGVALQSVIGNYWKKNLGEISRWHGFVIPDRNVGAWVIPTFHPSYIMRQEKSEEYRLVWKQDVKKVLDVLDNPFPAYKEQVHIVNDEEHAKEVLRMLLDRKPKFLYIDIETTGLKPYNRDSHKIICMSLCDNENESWVIPIPQDVTLLKRLLEHPKIGKLAHNMKFENNWLSVLCGIDVQPWVWDSMIAAHVLDNRPDITGLKFQVYVNFGVADYDSEIEQYLKADGSNSVNKTLDLWRSLSGRNKLMTYCGLDSLFGYRLAMNQMRLMT